MSYIAPQWRRRDRRLVLLHDLINHFRWRTRLTLWLTAALAGLVVAGFAVLSEQAQHAFLRLVAFNPLCAWLLPVVVPMLAVWLTRRYFPGSQGSGIPQAIAAIRLSSERQPVHQLVSLRIAVGKILVGCFGLLGGISAGREGPSVQVAASIMHAAHRWLPHGRAIRPQDLILAGSSAGIAAAFNTPLAGIVFAVEEMGRRLESRTSGVLLSTIILSGLMAISLLGNYSYFGSLHIPALSSAIVTPIIVCGIGCGLLGALFSRAMLWPQRYAGCRLWRWRAVHPVRFAGLCGLLLALMGWLSGGSSFGSGYAATSHLIDGSATLPWHAPLLRFGATLVTYFMGVPGGIFAPSLAVGAGIGNDLASWFFPLAGQHVIIALCMASFLAAVTQAPLTSAIIMMEMIDNHGMVISLMAACVLARFISARISPALYHQLSEGFMPPPARQDERRVRAQIDPPPAGP